jgi:O-antigen biosynthesis protein
MDNEETKAPLPDLVQLVTPIYTGPRIQRYFGGAWSMHLPFAWDLMKEFKPKVFVELGVYKGESYFCFCQSVAEHGLATRCYGIDTWRGDVHMGSYGPEIGREVKRYNRKYASFSKLLAMTFDEAVSQFANGSIDLLHIDGGHRYEEVKYDFENWLPKLSPRGVVLFHDVTERQDDFGVWRLWQEIARKNNSFVFHFGHGLGLWKKNHVSNEDSPFIRELLRANESQRCEITAYYAITGAALNFANAEEKRQQHLKTGTLQVFTPQAGSYSPAECRTSTFPKAAWRRIEVDLPLGAGDGSAPLRFDPGNEIGVIQIARVQLRTATNQLIWRAHGIAQLSDLVVGGTATVVPNERVFTILNYGVDPQVLLPLIDVASVSALKLEIWLRVDTAPETVATCFAALRSRQHAAQEKQRQRLAESEAQLRETERQRAALENNLRRLEEQNSKLENDLRNVEEQRSQLENDLRNVEKQRSQLENDLRRLKGQRSSLQVALREHQEQLAAQRSKIEHLQEQVWENRGRRADFSARLKQREKSIRDIQESFVWKAAKPLWKAERYLSRRKAPQARSAANELVFALDGPGGWNAQRDSVELTGSCFSRGGQQVVGVRAKIGRKSYFARYGLEREDVAKTETAYPAALYSGFSLRIPVTPETSVVRLEAITQNGPWQLLLEQPLAALAVSAPPPDRPTTLPEPASNERFDRPIHKNGNQPVLYPHVSADQAISLLDSNIQQHLARGRIGDPIITVITPTFNTAPRWFIEAGTSVLNQSFADWEWCLVDDGSQDVQTKQILESVAQLHPNIRVKQSPNRGISAATNEALETARGEFVCFLDHDDLLAPEALQTVYDKLSEGFDVVYSDEDKLDDKRAVLTEPFFKPDWSPEYFRGAMYVGHLLCLRRDLARRVRFDTTFDGVQDFEFMLRVSETGARIGHVSKILYHWRKTPGSIAESAQAKPEAAILQERAVNAQLQRLGLPAEARIGSAPHRLNIIPKPRSSSPQVSIIIPTKDSPELLGTCLKSVFGITAYPNYEVILVDNDTGNPRALEVMRQYPLTRIYLPNPFNFSRANNLAASRASGEYLVFLNNDTEIVSREWIDHLLYYAEQADVGAVGALLLHDDRSVQHGGVILGMRGTADHSMRGFGAASDGYAGSLSCAREVSAVTAACMGVRKSTFFDIGEFNEHFFTIYQDLDFCLRLRERGLRVIWTPRAVLLHHESVSRQSYYDVIDRYLLLDQWEEIIQRGDPYYNPNLNLQRGDYSLAPEP